MPYKDPELQKKYMRAYARRRARQGCDANRRAVRKYRDKDRGAARKRGADKRAQALNRQPAGASQLAILQIYQLAEFATEHLAQPYVVDHVVPLSSDFVCGLHWEYNLRVITKTENERKNNHTWPGMSDTSDAELRLLTKRFKCATNNNRLTQTKRKRSATVACPNAKKPRKDPA